MHGDHIFGLPGLLASLGLVGDTSGVDLYGPDPLDTYLNGVETTKILKRLKLNNVILVSHDYHLFRLVSVFEKLGINELLLAAAFASATFFLSLSKDF